jgi:hypothetical protein
MRSLHASWAWVAIFANGLTGAWALSGHWIEKVRHRSMWWAVGAAQATLFIQAALGATLVSELEEPPQFHMFYGFVSLVAVAVIYSYQKQIEHLRYLISGFGGIFLMGLAIRAMLL